MSDLRDRILRHLDLGALSEQDERRLLREAAEALDPETINAKWQPVIDRVRETAFQAASALQAEADAKIAEGFAEDSRRRSANAIQRRLGADIAALCDEAAMAGDAIAKAIRSQNDKSPLLCMGYIETKITEGK